MEKRWGQGANGAPFTVKAAKKSEAKDAAPAGLTVAATTSTKRPKKEEPLQEISDLSGPNGCSFWGREGSFPLEIWGFFESYKFKGGKTGRAMKDEWQVFFKEMC